MTQLENEPVTLGEANKKIIILTWIVKYLFVSFNNRKKTTASTSFFLTRKIDAANIFHKLFHT